MENGGIGKLGNGRIGKLENGRIGNGGMGNGEIVELGKWENKDSEKWENRKLGKSPSSHNPITLSSHNPITLSSHCTNKQYSFEDLEIWKKGRELRKKLSLLTKKFPSEEKYRLTDQIIRASRSVTANIAEGYGRFHYKENIQFCRQARASLYELIDHLITAYDEKYISGDTLKSLKVEIYTLIKKVNSYINYLKRKMGG